MTTVHVRTMAPADLDFAASCTSAVGWGSQRDEFEGFYAHDPGGCLVAEVGAPGEDAGEKIGICIATPYGEQGFLGMLIVLPEARGRGVGTRLLETAIDYLHGRGARIIGLDGVQAAVPLYERLGFRKQCRSLRFSGTLEGGRARSSVRAHPDVRPMVEADLDAVCALDRLAFGADRGFFLKRRLAQGPAVCQVLERDGRIEGYTLGRRTGSRVSVGPWVARPEVQRPVDLLEAIAAGVKGCTLALGILESNTAAVEAARCLGLVEHADPPWRMTRALPDAPGGTPTLGSSPLAYAVGSPAKG